MDSRPVRGFTLIELLVVIAIIGILSAVILGALALARLRAQDATIKSDLHTIQNQMEVYYSNNNSYGPVFNVPSSAQSNPPSSGSSVFVTDATVRKALTEALNQSGSGYWSVGQAGATWAIALKLKADSGYWWCVDSSGKPVRETDASVVSPGLRGNATTDATCP